MSTGLSSGRNLHKIAVRNEMAKCSLRAAQEAGEAFIAGVSENSNLLANHDKCVTVQPKDMQLYRNINRNNESI